MLLSAIEDRDCDKTRRYKVALLCIVLLIILEIIFVNYAIITMALLTFAVVLFGLIILKSRENKKNVAKYVFTDSRYGTLFEELRQLLLSLNEYPMVWCIAPSLDGNTSVLNDDVRSKMKVDLELPELFDIDFPLPSVKYAKFGKDVYEYILLPDSILLKTNDGIKIFPYNELEVEKKCVDFPEYGNNAPEDAQLIGWRWLYERVSGGPDLRYKNNPRHGVYRYYQIIFKHEGKEVLSLLTSKADGFDDLCLYFNELSVKIENLKNSTHEQVEAQATPEYVVSSQSPKTKTVYFCSDGNEDHLKILKDLDHYFGTSAIFKSSVDCQDEQMIIDSDLFVCVLDRGGNKKSISDALKLAFDLNKDVFIIDPYNCHSYRDQVRRCRRPIYILSSIDQYNQFFTDLYPVLGLLVPDSSTIVGHTINLAIHSRNGFFLSVDGKEDLFNDSNKIITLCFNKGNHKVVVSNLDRSIQYKNEFPIELCTWKTHFCVKQDLILNFDSFVKSRIESL